MHADRYFITEALGEAAGYVLKQSAGDELLAAIDEVIAGRRYLTTSSRRSMAFVLKGQLQN